jgi:hypothetical protein
MALIFNWSVNKMQVIENNIVSKVDLYVTATDSVNNLTASAAYTRNLIQGNNSIPYEQLTEQQVLDWCFVPEIITWTDKENVAHSITKDLKTEGEVQVTSQIERQLAQKVAEPALPWM